MELGKITDKWSQALGDQGTAAQGYLGDVQSGQTLGQQQIKKGIADAQRRFAAQAASMGNPGAERAAAFGAGGMASSAIGAGAAVNAQEEAAARQAQLQAAQSQAQGYQAQADWQQRKEEADRQFLGSIFSGIAGAAGGAAMMSDENRKVAIEHLRAGDADAALGALEGPPPDERERIGSEQAEMDRYIDSRMRREGFDPATMSDADHERAAVRIMGTPGGRAWAPGKDVPPDLAAALGAPATTPRKTMRALGAPVGLEALGAATDAELRRSVPSAARVMR